MEEKIIKHYGTPRFSGRYPWGSGGNAQQRNTSLLGYVAQLKSQGLTETQIAEGLGMTTTQLRLTKSIERNKQRSADTAKALKFKEKGLSNVAIGERMGLNESSVRALLDPVLKERAEIATKTANMLKDSVSKKGVIDVGAGVESNIGISRTKLNTSLELLKAEGYNVYYVQTQQLGTGKYTSIKVLAPPGMDYADVYKNRADIKTITDYTPDKGRSYLGLDPVKSISGDRVEVRYAEEGGINKDGIIELRRNVNDISLGNSKYAQVRIGVDGTHYMKGMAMYSDNLPEGVDIVYNTSKKSTTPRSEVFKEMKIDAVTGKVDTDNPFGATIKKGGQRETLNIVNEEGDWREWSRNISSQVLSKQSPKLAQKQLKLAADLKQEEFDEIMKLTNPAVKQKLLTAFADDCDSSSVHLKAAALPRQSSHVILPITSIKETEVYAPMFNNGERVVLIRHPHGGIFEIPELVVNNRGKEPNAIMKNALDAIGIHPKVAVKLSGADFDGDTVLVIPNKKGEIRTAPQLKALQDFDPRENYAPYDGMKTIDGGIYNAATRTVDYGGKKPVTSTKQLEMGKVSNLITDMTIKGATNPEIARAVKHSMVVIDAEKHHLNHKQSHLDNDIAGLKEIYQGSKTSGASTLISRASSELRVPHRKDQYKIDKITGEKIYEYTGETYLTKDGKLVKRTTKTTKMAEAKSAFDLSDGTKMETLYASYADRLKVLANKARLAVTQTPNLKYSPTANKTYTAEVTSLQAKLRIANKNKPLERQAQLLADKVYKAKLESNPDMDNADKKRLKGQALDEARARVGAKKQNIDITDNEWNAIQLGAVSHNVVSQILLNTDLDAIKIKATPRAAYKMTPVKEARAKSMAASGYTPAEIASALGVSTTTIVTTLK